MKLLNVSMTAFDKQVISGTKRVTAHTERHGNADIVFVNALCDRPLFEDDGAAILFDVGDISSFVADYRHCEFWCMPFFGKTTSEIPDETQCLITRQKNGEFGIFLPIVSKQYKCVFKGDKDGVKARLFSWDKGLNGINAPAFAFAYGSNPFSLLSDCVAATLKVLGTGIAPRDERRYPKIFEYLGWCSWDAMQIRVDEEGLLEKCREFKEKEIPVKWVIIDDMWAEVHEFYGAEYDDFRDMIDLMHGSRLYSFEADPRRFPNGLKACIEKIKNHGLKVGMWHPVTGYWYGIDPDGPIAKSCKENLIKLSNGMLIHGEKTGQAFGFYNAFHSFLKQSGADFVKVDNQSAIRRYYKGRGSVGEIASNIHTALEASVGAHFDGTMINCMGMASEDMWTRPNSAVSRCSDDFLPENPQWFIKHILQCSYNSMIQGQFLWCDYDMWWTDDAQAEKNSLLRAISGGPIYVSDKISRSRKEILEPLVFSNGRILRCDRPAMPTADCVTEDPQTSGKPFKLQNTCGTGGVIAAFNLSEKGKAVEGEIRPCDIDGIDENDVADVYQKYAVYEHFSGEFRILNYSEAADIRLENADDFKLYNIVPLKENGVTPIGLVNKYIAQRGIKQTIGDEVELFEGGKYAFVENGQLHIEDRFI